MNPLQPQDAFGTAHVAALLLIGIDALARDIEAMTEHAQARAFVEPDELHFALLAVCALGERVRSFGQNNQRPTIASRVSWSVDNAPGLR